MLRAAPFMIRPHGPVLAARRAGVLNSLLPLLLLCSCCCFWGPLPAGAVALPVPVRLCHIPLQYVPNDRIFARHAMFAAQYLQPRFPELNVTFDFATLDGGTTVQTVAQGMLSERAAACHGLVGPQWSSAAIAVSPLVQVPWISHTATSTELSDKRLHPWFSRVIPTDDFSGAGMAAAVADFGWLEASSLCVDDTYGRSVATGFANAFAERRGRMEKQDCFLADSSRAEVLEVLQGLLQLRTKVIVVAAASSRPSMSLMIDGIRELGMHLTHVFVFSESACGTNWARLADVPGSLCVSYTTDPAVAEPYAAAWAAHNPAMFAALPALGIPALDNPYDTGLYSYFIHDCVLLLLTALRDHFASQPNETVFDAKAVLNRLRTNQRAVAGATGGLRLDPATGNRLGARFVLQNVQPSTSSPSNFTITTYATWSENGGVVRNSSSSSQQLYWLAHGYGAPPGLYTAPASDSGDDGTPSAALLVSLLGVVVVAILLFALLLKVGCADSAAVSRLLYSGTATRFALMVMDVADGILGLVVASNVMSRPDVYSETSRYAVLIAAVAAFLGILVNVLTIGAFLRVYLAREGELLPVQLMRWKMRLGISSLISMLLSDVPLCVVLFYSIYDAGSGHTLPIVGFMVNSLLIGIKIDEVTLAPLWLQPDVSKLHEEVRGRHEDICPLTMESDADQRAAVLRTIERLSAPRFNVLHDSAKQVAVRLFNEMVFSDEFFAVVWRFMGEMYEHVDDDVVIDVVRRRQQEIADAQLKLPNPLSGIFEFDNVRGADVDDEDDDDKKESSLDGRVGAGEWEGLQFEPTNVMDESEETSRYVAKPTSSRRTTEYSGGEASTKSMSEKAAVMLPPPSVSDANRRLGPTAGGSAAATNRRRSTKAGSCTVASATLSATAPLMEDEDKLLLAHAKTVRIVDGRAVFEESMQLMTRVTAGGNAASDERSTQPPQRQQQETVAAMDAVSAALEHHRAMSIMAGMFMHIPSEAVFAQSAMLPYDSPQDRSKSLQAAASRSREAADDDDLRLPMRSPAAAADQPSDAGNRDTSGTPLSPLLAPEPPAEPQEETRRAMPCRMASSSDNDDVGQELPRPHPAGERAISSSGGDNDDTDDDGPVEHLPDVPFDG